MGIIPKEINILGVYMAPLLLAGIAGATAAYLLLYLLTRLRVTRYFYHIMLVYVALAVIFTVLFNRLILWLL